MGLENQLSELKRPGRRRERVSKKKGTLEETISYAMYNDDPRGYIVSYRDKDEIKEVNLDEFMNAEDYSPIPLTRIAQITKDGKVVWKKGQKELAVKNLKQIQNRQNYHNDRY